MLSSLQIRIIVQLLQQRFKLTKQVSLKTHHCLMLIPSRPGTEVTNIMAKFAHIRRTEENRQLLTVTLTDSILEISSFTSKNV